VKNICSLKIKECRRELQKNGFLKWQAGHSTHFQVGGDNPNVERKSVFYFQFDILIFVNKVAGRKCN